MNGYFRFLECLRLDMYMSAGGEVVLPVGHTRYFKVLAAHACGISPLLSAAAVDREVYMDRLQQLSEVS